MSPAGRAAAELPGGHVEGFADTFAALFRAIYADVAAGGMRADPPYATFAAGHEEMLVGDAIARSAREGRWVAVAADCTRRQSHETRFPDRALSRHAADGRLPTGPPRTTSTASRSPAGRHSGGVKRRYAGTSHIDVADLSDGAGAGHPRRDRGEGPGHLRPGLLSQPAAPRSEPCAEPAIAHIKLVIEACRKMGVPFMNTFMGGDSNKNVDQNWDEALRIWPEIVKHAKANGVQGDDRELPDDLHQRRVAGRQQHRLVALHLAAHHRAVGRHGRAQLRPVAPGLADDRPGPLHPRVRDAHPPLPGQGRPDRPRRPVRARLDVRPASAGRSRACPAWATPTGARSSPTCTASATTATASSSTRIAASRRPTR